MESGKRMGGNKMWTGIHVIQIMASGFLGALPKGTKLGQQGRQIPGELGALVKVMYNKECQDSITQISSRLTTYYGSVTGQHMRPEIEMKNREWNSDSY